MVAIFTLWVTGVRSARGGAAAHTRSGSDQAPRPLAGYISLCCLFFEFNKTFTFYVLHFSIIPHSISLF